MIRAFFSSTVKLASGPEPAPMGFLDDYPDAYRAFDTQLIYSDYTGPIMQIWSANIGEPTLDLYPNSEGKLDESEIVDYCNLYGRDFAEVTIWYDQSGNGRHWINNGANTGWLIYFNDSFYYKNGKHALVPSANSRYFQYTPSTYPTNINLFYGCDFTTSGNTAQRALFQKENSTGGFGISLLSQQSSTNTAYSYSSGPPSVYKNKVLQSIANRGDVYNLWATDGIICEKGINISSGWSPQKMRIGVGAITALGHRLTTVVEFHEDMTLTKLQGISDAINSSYETPFY